MFLKTLILAVGLFGLALFQEAKAGTLHVAVASNFTAPAKKIAQAFAAKTGYEAVLSFGSTGKHYIQIIKGAPFKVFLAADALRPKKLEDEGHGVPGSRFTYAQGQIALHSVVDGLNLEDGAILKQPEKFSRLAIANPKTAPYGKAAEEALENMGVLETVQDKVVKGNNIAQTYQFVSTRNAEVGLVALSQVKADPRGTHWVVPSQFYTPIDQQALLLKKGQNDAAAKAFINFLKSDDIRAMILASGYKISE